ncbi:Ribosomal RNA small subunit methyltransferase A [Flexistipes sinusarabici DSM 4947]|uniref:Ribosomal RNA small subunit methyltransferase A n=1 Tax=Flexistipes sinusarabici (strain ATCC 49648 / DSM 4947 / MAS 10) TaxID=717231 RepID=F8E973_FLESM|nr:16S rRNA (adenine(1518)-N(6)/adenine(1519)-N(6))-dimethyltransferase RsmA [Flexistipes sinusarabici]AEI15275.1 Ribosomal RNA small subunit methyltransferase A [Flexistipes sinusarabici DSM 4947]
MLKLTKIFRDEFGHTDKNFGQHFLVNDHYLNEIVESLEISDEKNIVEIGPGCGALTLKFLEKGAHVTAVEIDKKLVDFLERYLFFYNNLEIIHDDFLNIDKYQLPPQFSFAGNLPYNLSTKILMKTTAFHERIDKMVFMFQKEVASRINAVPNTKDYSWISVISRYFFDIKKIRNIGGGNFWPKTKVNSTVLVFTPRKRHFQDSNREKKFLEMVKKSFVTKRKTLKNNLKNEIPDIENILEELFANKSIRAEQISLEGFIKLYERIYT